MTDYRFRAPVHRSHHRHHSGVSWQREHPKRVACPTGIQSIILLAVITITLCAAASPAPPADAPRYGTWLCLPGVQGTVVVAGPKGSIPAINVFLEAAGGNGAKIAIVACKDGDGRVDDLAERCRKGGAEVVRVSPSENAALCDVNGAWLFDSDASLAPKLHALLNRGGAIGASGAAAEWLGGEMVGGGNTLSVLPGFVIYTIDHNPELLRAALQRYPGYVGLIIPDEAVLRITGRRAQVVMRPVTTVLSAGAGRKAMTKAWPRTTTLDLITISRAAVARTGEPFPAINPKKPEVVEGGTLYIAGGGQPSSRAIERFVKAAGGSDAKIVVIPTALGTGSAHMGAGDVRLLKRHGAQNVVIAHAATPEEAENPAFLEVLRDAGGIWFSGGRQWRLVDSYLGTKAHKLMHDVLARGGAIAGSSAGATIQAEYMVRGHPLGNTVMMAEGYEHGLGFLPGVAIDQHFTQRNRQRDMAAVKRRFPQLLGIGIDESTAVFVTGHIMEVVGANEVSVYDRTQSAQAHERTILRAGDRYDLNARRKLEPR